MIAFLPLSQLRQDSRPANFPSFLSIDGSVVCTWGEFWRRVGRVADYVRQSQAERWIISDEQVLPFTISLLAVLLNGRQACIARNQTAAARQEIGGSTIPVLSSAGLDGNPSLESLYQLNPERTDPEFVPTGVEGALLRLFTSGSTGEPKDVGKPIALVEAELANLHGLWGADLRNSVVFTTVAHHHFYGLLFYIFSPLCQGLPLCVDLISYPENLLDIQDFQVALVGSPAFYKRLVESPVSGLRFSQDPVFFSSGGALPPAVASTVAQQWGTPIREIYGSTETGGIAWRLSPDQALWTAFRGIEIRIAEDETIAIRSPYVDPTSWYQTADRGLLGPEGGLSLLGRSDNVVKIEEKRVSLNEVERRLLESPLVLEARVIDLQDSRQYLAAVLVLRPEGQSFLAAQGKLALNTFFRNWLRTWFEPTVLPRKWRFVEALPQDTMGKVAKSALAALFENRPPAIEQPIPGIVIEHVAINDQAAVIDFHLPTDSQWVAGHFPRFPLMPGVVQIDCLMRCAKLYLGRPLDLKAIPRLKFMKPITPQIPMRMELEYKPDNRQIVYRYLSRRDEVVYSSGKLLVEPSP